MILKLKQTLFLLIILISITTLTGCQRVPSPDEWTPDGFELIKSQDKYYVVEYTGNDSDITIPNKYKDLPVVALGFVNAAVFKLPSNVTKITISENIRKITSDEINSEYLEEIVVDESNLYFKSIDGVLFTKDGETLLQYPKEKKGIDYFVPNDVITLRTNGWSNELQNLYIYADYLVYLRCNPEVYNSLENIYVPSTLVDTYKEDLCWSVISDKIKAITP